MTAGEGSSYQIDSTRAVKEQVRRLAAGALVAGQRQEFLDALNAIVAQLQTRPLAWGEPERRTRKQGGSVRRGAWRPLFVRYVVYEEEKALCILKVQALPGSPLAE